MEAHKLLRAGIQIRDGIADPQENDTLPGVRYVGHETNVAVDSRKSSVLVCVGHYSKSGSPPSNCY